MRKQGKRKDWFFVYFSVLMTCQVFHGRTLRRKVLQIDVINLEKT